MTILVAPAGLALFQAAAAARDTLVVRPLPPVRSTVEQVFFYAAGLTSILTLVLVLMLVVAVFWMRRAAAAAARRVDDLLDELRPMLKEAAQTAESVRETADLIQEEVSLVKDGVNETGVRVKKTVGELADRVDDFNDLLGKVHSRADAVVGVAGSAMEGIAWGARKLRERKQKRIRKKA
jgi:methyl-accepting chemotaxis protein